MKQTSQPSPVHHDAQKRTARYSLYGRMMSVVQIIVECFCFVILKIGGGFTVVSRHELNSSTRYLFIANHQSRWDPFAVFSTLLFRSTLSALPIRFLTAKGIYYSPLRPILKILGCYPTRSRELTVHESVNLLKRGYSVFLFPEGRRTLKSESQPRPGVSHIIQTASAECDFEIILIHIEWQRKRFGRRHLIVSLQKAPDELREKNETALMAAVYAV